MYSGLLSSIIVLVNCRIFAPVNCVLIAINPRIDGARTLRRDLATVSCQPVVLLNAKKSDLKLTLEHMELTVL